MKLFSEWHRTGLVWLPEHGIGFYPVDECDEPYDEEYFNKYVEYADSDMGVRLNCRRIEFVDSFIYRSMDVCDVGIGCGQFIEKRGFARTVGYDVNPAAATWLFKRHAFFDIRAEPIYAATFWDSLEHILSPERVLANVQAWAFVSIPIFEGPEHVLRSRHYRKDEHRWYFTRDGLIEWMRQLGFQCRAHNTMESLEGREDIHSFAFFRAFE